MPSHTGDGDADEDDEEEDEDEDEERGVGDPPGLGLGLGLAGRRRGSAHALPVKRAGWRRVRGSGAAVAQTSVRQEGGGARAAGVWRRRVAKTVARSRRAHSATRTRTGRSAIAETHGIGEEKGGERIMT